MISVIIPTCNRKDLLSKCLDRLHPAIQSVSPGLYEVIVTDDSNNSVSKDLISKNYDWIKWVQGLKKGPAANRNNGAKHASGKWLIFIDDDVIPGTKFINEYAKAIQVNSNVLAFEGAILPDKAKLLKKDMAECPVNTTGNCFWSANICVNTSLFKKLNGFDEQFLIAAQEDQDLYERLKKETAVIFLPKCIVIHPVRVVSFFSKLKKIKIQFSNWIYYLKKHSDISIHKHLRKACKDYIRMSIREMLRFNFRLSVLFAINSFYSAYLFLKK